MLRKELVLYDNSWTSVEMTLWGDIAATSFPEGSVLLISDVRVSSFKTLSLSANNQTDIALDALHIPDVGNLKSWGKQAKIDVSNLASLTTMAR